MNTIINSDDIKKQIDEISNFLNSDQIDEIARLTGFVQRNSKLTGTIFLSIFTLGMNIYQRPSLTQLIGLLKIIIPDLEISREGFHQRINQYAVTFFEFMLSQAINISIKEVDLNLLINFKRVLIIDSTMIELPKELEEVFKGCGGKASVSSLKIQFCYDLKLGKFFYLFQDGISPDNKYENSFVEKIEQYDLIIKDLGYFNPQAFIDLSEKGAYFLSRWKSNIEIYVKNENDELVPLDIAKFLKKVNQITEVEIYIKKSEQLSKARLVIEKVPKEVREARLRKLQQTNKRKGRQTKDLTKLFQAYNIYVSNVPEDFLSMNNFRKLYGIRWQIELVFKNWKSNFNLDKISGIKPERIKCMLYSRLLLIFITSKIIFQLRNIWWMESRREISEIKASKHLNIIFMEVLKLTIKKQSKKITGLLVEAIKFIDKNCQKIKQKSRPYPLDIISSMGLA